MQTQIQTPKDTYTIDYPKAIEYADQQNRIFWTHEEIAMEKDVQDILVNMSEAERHGVITVLKLFTQYELSVGNEFWGGRIKDMFPRPDIQRMSNCFSFFELNIHAPFYNKINELLHLNTDEFYSSYKQDQDLSERMDYLDECLSNPDDLFALGVFSMVEGAILYSNFAFLKHFQAQGKNKLTNLVAGINFSQKDEGLHAEASAWLFRTLLHEKQLNPEDIDWLHDRLRQAGEVIRQHEHKIVDKIFEKGRIEGITAKQMKVFVDSRINLCFEHLGMSPEYETKNNPIAEWFYLGTSSNAVIHDFFNSIGSQYHRKWNESGFEW